MAQRYVGELQGALPEVDAFLGTSDYAKIEDVLAGFGMGSVKKKGKSLPIVEGPATSTAAAHAHGHDHDHSHDHHHDHDHDHHDHDHGNGGEIYLSGFVHS